MDHAMILDAMLLLPWSLLALFLGWFFRMSDAAADTTTPTLLVIQTAYFVFGGHATNYFLLIFVILDWIPKNIGFVMMHTKNNKK
jgi:hypothetical protein